MAKASINFKPVKENSTRHNERIGTLEYVYSDLTKNNEHWKVDEVNNRLEEIEKLTKELTGRKMQAKATPIREAVVNLNSKHGLKDLQNLSQILRKEKGIDCFQIHIHRDEGKSKDELNYHAHMLFDWQDKKTGKSFKLLRHDMSQIQDLVSSTLKMERGELKENSNRERLEAVEYKRQQEEIKLEKLQTEIEVLEQKKNTAAKRNQAAREQHENFGGQNSRFKQLKQRSEELANKGVSKYSSSLRSENKELNRAIELQQEEAQQQQTEFASIQSEIERLEKSPEFKKFQEQIRTIRAYQKEADQSRKYQEEIERLLEQIRAIEKSNKG